MRGKSLLNEKAILILSFNQSECRKLLRSASSRIGFSLDTRIEENLQDEVDLISKYNVTIHFAWFSLSSSCSLQYFDYEMRLQHMFPETYLSFTCSG